MNEPIEVIPRSALIDSSMKFTSSDNNIHLNTSNVITEENTNVESKPIQSKHYIDIFNILSTYKYHILIFVIILILLLFVYILYKKYIIENKIKNKVIDIPQQQLNTKLENTIKESHKEDIKKYIIDDDDDDESDINENEINNIIINDNNINEEQINESYINNKIHSISNEIEMVNIEKNNYNFDENSVEHIKYIISQNHNLPIYDNNDINIINKNNTTYIEDINEIDTENNTYNDSENNDSEKEDSIEEDNIEKDITEEDTEFHIPELKKNKSKKLKKKDNIDYLSKFNSLKK